MGRPSTFSQDKIDAICKKLMEGKSLRKICAEADMPSMATVIRWLGENEAFQAQYARARDVQADVLADEILDISDEQAMVTTEAGTTYDPDVQRDRLRIDARKWYASKLAPKRYGDKIEHSGKVEGGFALVVTPLGQPNK